MIRAAFSISCFFLFTTILSAQLVGTFAGVRDSSGNQDGPGSAATFNNPHGIAISQTGNVYICDRFNHLIRKISPDGIVSTLAGNPGVIGDTDGYGTEAHFYEPWGICVDHNENVFVSDTRNNKIKKIAPDGEVTTYAGTGNYGTTNGPWNACTFGKPVGIEADGQGNLYVVDHGTHIVRKVGADGMVTTLAGTPYTTGDEDGEGASAKFNKPYGLTLDLNGDILITDEWNHKVKRITPEGFVSTVAGTGEAGGEDGEGSTATLKYPWDVTVDSSGIIYVADGLNFSIRKIVPDGAVEVTTLAGAIGSSGNEDGVGTEARFSGATGVAFSPLTREIFVADAFNNLVRKITDPSQGVFLDLDSGLSTYCPEDPVSITAYPDVYDAFHFYLDDVLIASDSMPAFDSLGIPPGVHQLKVVADLDTFTVHSNPITFEVYDTVTATIDVVGPTTFFEGDSVIMISSFGQEYFWSNGEITPTITVRESGVYNVEVTDFNGCVTVSDTIGVTVRTDPDAALIFVDGALVFCDGDSTVLSSNYENNVQWFRDGWSIAGATEAQYIVKSPGLYQIQHTNDEGTVVMSEPIVIDVLSSPDADFRAERTWVKPGENVRIFALSENMSTYEWNFGGGLGSLHTIQNPEISFPDVGTYDISLFVIDENGCTNNHTKHEYIKVDLNADPTVNPDDVFVANAFSPNNDGINDELFVRGSDVASMQFRVFSQAGKLLFESGDLSEGWDGYLGTQKAPPGNYRFLLTYTNLLGVQRQKSGKVLLIR